MVGVGGGSSKTFQRVSPLTGGLPIQIITISGLTLDLRLFGRLIISSPSSPIPWPGRLSTDPGVDKVVGRVEVQIETSRPKTKSTKTKYL